MLNFQNVRSLAAIVAAGAVLSACGSGSSPGPAVVPAQPGGGPVGSPAQNVAIYKPHATIYYENYATSGPATAGPFTPLAVSPDGTQVWFFDNNYGAVQFAGGTFTLHQVQYPQQGGHEWATAGPLAFDASGSLYENSYCQPTQTACWYGYVRNPYTSPQVPVQAGTGASNGGFNDIEGTTTGALLGAGPDGQFTVINNPQSTSPAISSTNIPTQRPPCAYRAVQGTQGDYYVSGCANAFNQIFRYSSSLQLLASATVPNATNIASLTPDPAGGVWFADSHNGPIGKVGTSGAVTIYNSFPSGFVPVAVTTAADGSIWAGGYTTAQGNVTGAVAHIVPGSTAAIYPIPGFDGVTELKGTFGYANCGFNGLYALDDEGNIAVITLF